MKLRPFDAAAGDASRLGQFRCSTGPAFEDDVEAWIRTDAVGWANDLPQARFQRRTLAFVEDGEATTAVVAWHDITRVDLEGIWLEVLAVALDHQHDGQGQAAYELTVDHLRAVERDGDHLAGLVTSTTSAANGSSPLSAGAPSHRGMTTSCGSAHSDRASAGDLANGALSTRGPMDVT